MASIQFPSILKAFGNNTGILVPEEQLKILTASKRPTVRVLVNGYRFESVVASMDRHFVISFSKAHRQASGLVPNQVIEVTLTLLETPRTIELPLDIKSRFEKEGVFDAFEASSFSYKKECILSIESSKKEDTRETRIQKWIIDLKTKQIKS
jgi:hypothetical protein